MLPTPGEEREKERKGPGDSKPVGFFDSGVGGLSLWREVVARLPCEHTVYLSDNANCPYGRKPADVLIERSGQLVSALLEEGCKLIVVACNTATAAAIDSLRERFPVPFVGMEPAVKPAALRSRTGTIGILATEGTFNGRLFRETSSRFAAGVRLVVKVGDGLVELVEAGRSGTEEARKAVEAQVRPMLEQGIDHLVLGCTHFSFLTDLIQSLAGRSVTVLDASGAVARQVECVLDTSGLRSHREPPAAHRFIASGDPSVLRRMLLDLGWRTVPVSRTPCGLEGTRVFAARGV